VASVGSPWGDQNRTKQLSGTDAYRNQANQYSRLPRFATVVAAKVARLITVYIRIVAWLRIIA